MALWDDYDWSVVAFSCQIKCISACPLYQFWKVFLLIYFTQGSIMSHNQNRLRRESHHWKLWFWSKKKSENQTKRQDCVFNSFNEEKNYNLINPIWKFTMVNYHKGSTTNDVIKLKTTMEKYKTTPLKNLYFKFIAKYSYVYKYIHEYFESIARPIRSLQSRFLAAALWLVESSL